VKGAAMEIGYTLMGEGASRVMVLHGWLASPY
jgi:hypothetical protein